MNLKELYPELDKVSNAGLKLRITRMLLEAEAFERDHFNTSSERSLEIACLLESELARRVSEQGDQARARSVARMVEETVAKSVPDTRTG